MRALLSRLRMIAEYVAEYARHGAATLIGDPRHGIVFILDGVGGFQMGPLLVRKGLRQAGATLATHLFRWHGGPPGEMLGDLICLRRNRWQAARLARRIRAARRQTPNATLHVVAFSGGAGVAVFAAERLGPYTSIDTLILACPALSPTYPLTPALRHVGRCLALVSRRDIGFLGWGTRLLGTVDRHFGPAAGFTGFDPPRVAYPDDVEQYAKLQHIHWRPADRPLGHYGQHMGWATTAYVRERIAGWLQKDP